MWVGLLTDRINNKLERSNLINEHALNREPVPLTKLNTINKQNTKTEKKKETTKLHLKTPIF